MINAIILDFGDIFINLKKEAAVEAFKKLGLDHFPDDLAKQNIRFERGEITELEFINSFLKYLPEAGIDDIRAAWNSSLGDFPLYRLEFLQMLSYKYRLFLLTNTDAIHISKFEHMVGMSFYNDFYHCFEKIYFSYEVGMRKPEKKLFETILFNHDLQPKRTLFVDDKKVNTDAAAELGLHVWNLQPGKEDIVNLLEQKNIPF